jgi:hypothetical protein
MKVKEVLSTIVASLLIGTTALSASALHDSVSAKEAKALQHPSAVTDHSQAQAQVEDTMSKDHYMAKLDADNFKTEVQRDDAKRLHKILDKEIHNHNLTKKQAPKEIMSGLQNTIMALRALQHNNKTAAKQALQNATKSFDAALKKDPKLDMVPVDERISVNDFTGDAKLVKHIKDAATSLLKDNDTQAARAMILPLEDEMTITTQYLPMKLYPEATKQAQKDLAKGNNKAAFGDIVGALHSVVAESVIIPIPLLTAQDMVLEASKLGKKDKTKALKLLSSAQDELQKAVLLGYTKKHAKAYKSLENEIKSIKHAVDGGNSVDKMYEHIKHSFESLLSLHRKEAHKDSTKK